ncbi:MAG: asparaginase, partial [Clostridia bacterium]|nr:asparaginase [Clostridia bacterium]
MKNDKKVLIIYTGGTIGMKNTREGYAPVSGYLLGELNKIEDLNRADMPQWDFIEFDTLLDSSNVSAKEWNGIAKTIVDNYSAYDGFVIL